MRSVKNILPIWLYFHQWSPFITSLVLHLPSRSETRKVFMANRENRVMYSCLAQFICNIFVVYIFVIYSCLAQVSQLVPKGRIRFWDKFKLVHLGKWETVSCVLDSIAASLFENNWLSWQIVSDDKIQITLLILGRGALSTTWARHGADFTLTKVKVWDQTGRWGMGSFAIPFRCQYFPKQIFSLNCP